jgi:hypothetical protein
MEGDMNERSTSSQETSKPFGPVAAALLAAGISSLILGLLTTISEANASFADKMNWYNPVGPLSGKTLISVTTFAASWLILHFALRRKEPAPGPVYLVSGLLVVGGFLGTLPTFFDLFKP